MNEHQLFNVVKSESISSRHTSIASAKAAMKKHGLVQAHYPVLLDAAKKLEELKQEKRKKKPGTDARTTRSKNLNILTTAEMSSKKTNSNIFEGMNMLIKIYKSDFIREFDKIGRSENFTIEARAALFDYLDDIGDDLEVDIIMLCCEWSEYENEADLLSVYSMNCDTLDDIKEKTIIIKLNNGGFLVNNF